MTMILIQELIAKKRKGEELTCEELNWFVQHLTNEVISEGQVAALAMAICIKGMTLRERVALTLSMRDSGRTLNWNLPGPVVDKHSTGGVGDAVSLLLAPILAACGAYVPMISGRGLGHTGGTLDKFESIPGYNTKPDEKLFTKVVTEVGCAIIGQTSELAPADKRFYSIRDVTGTVDSVDLITASILSKKLAAGLEGLVLDVKCGNGAFMTELSEASNLARSLVKVANGSGCKTSAIVTDMDQPLSKSIGNSLEIYAVIDILKGDHFDDRLLKVTYALGENILCSSGLTANKVEARVLMEEVLSNGRVAEKFARMVSGLGGPKDLLEKPEKYLKQAKISGEICATESGYINHINTKKLGNTLIALGGGRRRLEDKIDHSVGIKFLVELGSSVEKGQPIVKLYASSSDLFENSYEEIVQSIKIESFNQMVRLDPIIEYFE